MLSFALFFLFSTASAHSPAPTAPTNVQRGEQLAHVAGCGSCHISPEGIPFAGGYGIETQYGTYFGPNLTPDPQNGLGDWTLDDFNRALHRGKSPSGKPYWAAFPYPSFTQLTEADRADLFAYLQSLPPSDRPNDKHQLKGLYSWRLLGRFWRLVGFNASDFSPHPDEDAALAAGRYWVDAVAHCGECHTPRSGIGVMDSSNYLGGNHEGPEPAPNISPRALGYWTASDWETFLEMGMTADGDFVGGEMGRVIRDGTARLSKAERHAMALYLLSVPPAGDAPTARPVEDDDW